MINSDYNLKQIISVPSQEIIEKNSIDNKVNKLFNETQNEITSSQEIISESTIKNESKISNDRMISQVISHLQEIFISLKKEYTILKEKYPSLAQEYQTLPSFNQWLKKSLEENCFFSNTLFSFIYFNTLINLDKLKNHSEIKKNKVFQNEVFSLDYILLLLRNINYKNIDSVKTFFNFTSVHLPLISSYNSIDISTKNKFILIFLFINKLLLHPELAKILAVLDQTTIKNLILHPSLNIKFNYSLKTIKEQFKDNLAFYLNHASFLNNVFNEFKKKNLNFETVSSINDYNKNVIEKENVFTPLIGCRKIFKEIENLLNLLSQRNNSLEVSFELLKNLQIINVNFLYFSLFNNSEDLNHPFFKQIFNNVPILRNYLNAYKNFETSITSKSIFTLINDISSTFKNNILDIYSYSFTLQLIEEGKINNLKSIANYFNEVLNVMTIILNYVAIKSTENKKPFENFNCIIKKNHEIINKYKNESYLSKLNNKNNVFEIFIAVQEIIDTYMFLEDIIKDFILTEIKVHMFSLKNENNEDLIVIRKNDLNMLTNTYDLCLNVLNQTHKLLNLFSEDQFNLPTEQLSYTELNEEEVKDSTLLESVSKNFIDDKNIEKKEEESLIAPETKNESHIKLETKKEILREEIEFQEPSLETEEPLSEQTILDEYSEYLDETGWKAHMKRREILQILTQNGWKINASSGKGSHVKAEGPNGTVVIVPHKSTIAKGTNRSIEESFLLDKKKSNQTENKKEAKSITKNKKKSTLKKKNKPKRK